MEYDAMKIIVTRIIPDRGLNLLREAFGDASVVVTRQDGPIPRAELLKIVQGADALLPMLTDRIDDELLDAAGPQLKIVANNAVGYDNIDVPAAMRHGVIVTNTPGVLTETTADLAWTLMMAAARRVGEGERFLRGGKWTCWSPMQLLGMDIHGATLGIFGMGRIGQAMARRAAGFGMKVIYTDSFRMAGGAEKSLNVTYVDKDTLVRESDFISCHCPLTPDTRHAFSTAEFAAMKSTAVFVNTSRGPVVDEAALAEALQSGKIFAAGIDVFEQEPKVHPALLECENAVLIPHLGSASVETRSRMAAIAAQNIVACLRGETPPNVVQG
jgi:glyoxylate reductase